MSLRERISEDMKAAMKGGEKERLAAIRLIHAAVRQREVDERITLDDAQMLATLDKMAKQRRDSISQFRAAGREDLAAKEEFELGVVQGYMPSALGDEELDAILAAAIAETGASGPRDMGKVMALMRPRVAGRADMVAVAALVKQRLGG